MSSSEAAKQFLAISHIGLAFCFLRFSQLLIKTHLPDMSGNPTSTVIFPRSHKAAAPLLSRQMGISSLTCSVRDREAGQQDHLRQFAQTDGKILEIVFPYRKGEHYSITKGVYTEEFRSRHMAGRLSSMYGCCGARNLNLVS